jgi:hypothetical protein
MSATRATQAQAAARQTTTSRSKKKQAKDIGSAEQRQHGGEVPLAGRRDRAAHSDGRGAAVTGPPPHNNSLIKVG